MTHHSELYISAFRAPADSEFSAMASWDYYNLHRLVCSGFPDRQVARKARILFRFDIEGDSGFLYVQTKIKPDWSGLDLAPNVAIVGPRLLRLPPMQPEMRLRFRLLARPARRIAAKSSPDRGRRLSLIHEQEQRDWLDRKAAIHGFLVDHCTMLNRVWHDTKHPERLPNGPPKPITATLFEGVLVVTDPGKLQHALSNGIGPQKAFGFGLLSVAPPA